MVNYQNQCNFKLSKSGNFNKFATVILDKVPVAVSIRFIMPSFVRHQALAVIFSYHHMLNIQSLTTNERGYGEPLLLKQPPSPHQYRYSIFHISSST